MFKVSPASMSPTLLEFAKLDTSRQMTGRTPKIANSGKETSATFHVTFPLSSILEITWSPPSISQRYLPWLFWSPLARAN